MGNTPFLKTERLVIRQFDWDDLDDLFSLLSNETVMKYYPSTLTKEDTNLWLEGILDEYKKYGYSWWAVCLRDSGQFTGQAGILHRKVEGETKYLLSYMFNNRFWGQGYATEAVRSIVEYAFSELGMKRIDCTIRPINLPSVNLAKRVGLKPEKRVNYKGLEHDLYFTESN